MLSPSSIVVPAYTHCVPGCNGSHALSMVVEPSKWLGSKSARSFSTAARLAVASGIAVAVRASGAGWPRQAETISNKAAITPTTRGLRISTSFQ
jgi:hypothetical protein